MSGVAPEPQLAQAVSLRPASRRTTFFSPDWLPGALMVGDAAIVGFAVLASYWIHTNVDSIRKVAPSGLPLGPYLAAVPVVIVLCVIALAISQQYRSWRGRTLLDQILGLYSGMALAGMFMLAAISLANLSLWYSRLTIAYTLIIASALMTAERFLLRQYETSLRRQGIGTERVLVVGTGAGSQLIIERMSMFPQYGFQVCGVVDSRLELGTAYAGKPVVGRIEDLPQLIRTLDVDQVFLAVPGASRDELVHLINTCEDQQVEFKILPDLLEVMSSRVAADAIDGIPLVGVRRNRLRGGNAVLKRSIDIVVSSVLLIPAIPLMLIVALLIRLTSRGPVLFRQERVGLNGRPFVLLKFRTMIQDAEAKTGPVVATAGDDRCTRVGRILRRLSLDELPQLYNILRGHMSLVGPRPMRPFLVDRYRGEVPRYLERHQVRPGLTGWAEVNDLRGAAPIADRAMYDIYYVENWSLALDLKIVLLTAIRVFFQRQAY